MEPHGWLVWMFFSVVGCDLGFLLEGSPLHPQTQLPELQASIWSPDPRNSSVHSSVWEPPHWYSTAALNSKGTLSLKILLVHSDTNYQVTVTAKRSTAVFDLKRMIQDNCLHACPEEAVARDPSLPGEVHTDRLVVYVGTGDLKCRIFDKWPLASVALMGGRSTTESLKKEFRVTYSILPTTDPARLNPDYVPDVLKPWETIAPVVCGIVLIHGTNVLSFLKAINTTERTDVRLITLRGLCDGLQDEKSIIEQYPFLENMRLASRCVIIHVALS